MSLQMDARARRTEAGDWRTLCDIGLSTRPPVVPTNVTIPLNVTALDECHNSPRQMSQLTTNVTTLPRQMSQPSTNVTTLPRQMSQPRQMPVVISPGQAGPLFHWSDVEYYTWSETHNIFI